VSSTTPDSQRLFFALWPDAVLQEAIDSHAHKLIGKHAKRVPAHNLHITLAFLGPVPRGLRACYEQAAAGIQAQAFTLNLQCIGHWPKPRILWLGPPQQPEAMLTLVQNLNAALSTCGYSPETRPYQAHMTLARKVDRPLPVRDIEPIDWAVDSFALVESVTAPEGPRYQVLARWSLQRET
jgi:RNA 2',3'-cyclic 3'-phosphodiesterase